MMQMNIFQKKLLQKFKENTSETVSGSGYMTDMTTMVWMDTEQYKKMQYRILAKKSWKKNWSIMKKGAVK